MRVRRIPKDGNCLFHSCAYLLSTCQCRVRKEVSRVVLNHSETIVNGQSIADWVKFNGYDSPEDYAQAMRENGTWGDGLALTIISLTYNRPIDVYQRSSDGFEIMTQYFPELGSDPLRLLYSKGHYDVLVEDSE